jgi:hypothetical protein
MQSTILKEEPKRKTSKVQSVILWRGGSCTKNVQKRQEGGSCTLSVLLQVVFLGGTEKKKIYIEESGGGVGQVGRLHAVRTPSFCRHTATVV